MPFSFILLQQNKKSHVKQVFAPELAYERLSECFSLSLCLKNFEHRLTYKNLKQLDMTSIIIASNMVSVAFDTLMLIVFFRLCIATIRLVAKKNYKGAIKVGGCVLLGTLLAFIGDMPRLYITYIKNLCAIFF